MDLNVKCSNCENENAYFDHYEFKYICPDCGYEWTTPQTEAMRKEFEEDNE